MPFIWAHPLATLVFANAFFAFWQKLTQGVLQGSLRSVLRTRLPFDKLRDHGGLPPTLRF